MQEYDRRVNHKGAHEKIAIVRFKDRELDPYIAAIRFTDYIRFCKLFLDILNIFISLNKYS